MLPDQLRVALRLARGWSQRDAAEHWNARWPWEPKTFKNFSYWENWPSSTGHTPSLDVLARLAELYECRTADLLADAPDFRSQDTAYRARTGMAELSAPGCNGQAGAELADRVDELDLPELARISAAWASGVEPAARRRPGLLSSVRPSPSPPRHRGWAVTRWTMRSAEHWPRATSA